ncbi:MAG: hypothetical protein IJ821_04800 [Lachnospiraceae bacterium]|nr:hypothetical protein [Lachnospiraceae bacterium]
MNRCVCKGENPLAIIGAASPNLSNNSYLYIEGKDLLIMNDRPDIPTIYVPIKFCPICGKELNQSIRTQSA